MSNPETELKEEPGNNSEAELSEADILKRLEPKEEEDSESSALSGGEDEENGADQG